MPTHPVAQPDWIASAPIQVNETIEIDAPPSAVWPHIADHESWPEWFTDLDTVERIGAGEGVGSGRTVTARRLKIHEEFTAWDVDERFAFSFVKTPFPVIARAAEDVRLEATETGTRVTYRHGVEGRRFVGGLAALMWKPMPGQVANALANLKARVESS